MGKTPKFGTAFNFFFTIPKIEILEKWGKVNGGVEYTVTLFALFPVLAISCQPANFHRINYNADLETVSWKIGKDYNFCYKRTDSFSLCIQCHKVIK